MSDKKPLNEGYQPLEKGYKPASSQPQPVEMPNQGQPGAGYQPTISEGESPGNPPKKP
ncbi:hypothetical protein [Microbulbifer sp. JSM ZJ756]|uniref:hypothetical protein n=1 Tax=Microbulbifer sp. JSM ZJ756 TaxID=3376191 RepID=UPI0037BBB43E